jgi:recombination protein RecA
MAKVKEKEPVEEKEQDLKKKAKERDSLSIEKYIEKEFGEDVLIDANAVFSGERKIIPFTPSLDLSLCGGIPEGRWCIISGPPKCGKTTLALQIAANAQQLYGKDIYYGKVEGRLEKKNLKGIHNLDADKIKVIQSVKGRILTAEDFITIFIQVIKKQPGCVLIIDSASALCSEKEMIDDVTAQTRNLGPKLLATFCRQMGNVVPVQDTLVIIIQHIITNTSGHGAKYMEDGGLKIQFQDDVKLRAKYFEKWKEGENLIGQKVHWDIVYSALGPPGGEVEGYLRYGYGFDKEMELLSIACDYGLVEKAGSWYTIIETNEKFQGLYKGANLLREKPDLYQTMYKTIMDMA